MKTLKFILPAFFLLPISLVFAQQDVAGTYVWVGAGCRDSNLSESSHESRPKKHPAGLPGLFRVIDIKFTLNRDGSAVSTVEGDDGKKNGETYKKQDIGTYRVQNNKVVFFKIDPESGEQISSPADTLNIVGDYLILSLEGAETYDDRDFNATICDSNKVFVFVFGNIN